MKLKDKNKLINLLIFDKRLGAPHFRLLLLVANRKEWTVKEVAAELGMHVQQANLAVNKLIEWGYVRIVGKMESGRVLFYSINEDCLIDEPGQLTIDDISTNS